jgi:hypothetical protein
LYARITVLLTDLAYFFFAFFVRDERPKFRMGHLNLFLTLGYYMLPLTFTVAEAWSNAIFETLFEHLLAEDYNKNLDSFFQSSNPSYLLNSNDASALRKSGNQ